MPEACSSPLAEVAYRELPVEEWGKVEPIFAEHGSRLPHEEMASIFVAEKGGDVVGMAVMQMVPHLEPIWIKKGQGEHYLKKLIHMAEASLAGGSGDYFAFSASTHVSNLCKAFGLDFTGWAVWKKRI